MKIYVKVIFLLIAFNIPAFIYSNNDRIFTKNAIVMVDKLVLRSAPKKESKAITFLNKGYLIEILSSTKDKYKIDDMDDYWYQVKYKDKKGYVYGYYISQYENKPFVISEKLGLIFFINNNKIIKEIGYNSLYKSNIKAENNKMIDNVITADIVDNIDNNFLLLKKIAGWYSSEYFINSFIFYDKYGNIIRSEKGYPVININKAKKIIIINKAVQIKSLKIEYLNELVLLDYNGRLIKQIKLNYNQYYEYNNFGDRFFISQNNNYYVWITNTASIIVNLKNFKSNVIYHKITKYHPGKYYLNLKNVIESKNTLNLYLEAVEINKINNKYDFNISLNLSKL